MKIYGIDHVSKHGEDTYYLFKTKKKCREQVEALLSELTVEMGELITLTNIYDITGECIKLFQEEVI